MTKKSEKAKPYTAYVFVKWTRYTYEELKALLDMMDAPDMEFEMEQEKPEFEPEAEDEEDCDMVLGMEHTTISQVISLEIPGLEDVQKEDQQALFVSALLPVVQQNELWCGGDVPEILESGKNILWTCQACSTSEAIYNEYRSRATMFDSAAAPARPGR